MNNTKRKVHYKKLASKYANITPSTNINIFLTLICIVIIYLLFLTINNKGK